MKIPDEIIEYYLQAKKVDFLTEKWERDWYALSCSDQPLGARK